MKCNQLKKNPQTLVKLFYPYFENVKKSIDFLGKLSDCLCLGIRFQTGKYGSDRPIKA